MPPAFDARLVMPALMPRATPVHADDSALLHVLEAYNETLKAELKRQLGSRRGSGDEAVRAEWAIAEFSPVTKVSLFGLRLLPGTRVGICRVRSKPAGCIAIAREPAPRRYRRREAGPFSLGFGGDGMAGLLAFPTPVPGLPARRHSEPCNAVSSEIASHQRLVRLR
jgi:hypothetical protein